MSGAVTQAARETERAHLVVYDGVCGMCSRLVQFVLEHDRRAIFRFASLQSGTGRAMVQRWGHDPTELTSFYVCANYKAPEAKAFSKSRATLFVAGELGWPWNLTRVASVLPTALLDRLYDIVARHRYHVFGRLEHCLAPSEEFRSRFVD